MRSFIERIRFALWFRRVQQHLVVLLDDEAWWQYEAAAVERYRREFAALWLAGVDPWTAAENYYRDITDPIFDIRETLNRISSAAASLYAKA